jgi:light-regulated signal transduction histidine kinase (bacteriophytochrome)
LKQNNPDRKTNFIINPTVRAMADKGLIEIMLKNLLDNAWKFTAKKKITKIEFGEIIKNNQKVIFIKDNGVGFDMTYVDKIFEPFQRQNKEYVGTGIGLTIVQRIINRHGGRIWAEGIVNEGAIFYFTL